MKTVERLRRGARALRTHVAALRLAASDPRVPRASKLLIVGAAAYAASPIDLIPDFIPVLGQLDDLVLVPALLWIAIHLVPREVWADCRRRAELAAADPSGPTDVPADPT